MELVDTSYLLGLDAEMKFNIEYYDVELIKSYHNYHVIVMEDKYTPKQTIVIDREFHDYDVALHMYWYYVNNTIVNYWSENNFIYKEDDE